MMLYALTETTKKMSNAERIKFLNDFSEYLVRCQQKYLNNEAF